jgi:hypothetical protein
LIRRDDLAVAVAATVASVLALAWFAAHHELLLYGDAVAHLHIARRIFDTDSPALSNLGSVWLPLPHLLLMPFVLVTALWHSGFAGAPPSMLSYIAAVVAMFRLAKRWLPSRWATLAAFAFAINPGLLYMQTTAMTEPLFLALLRGHCFWQAFYSCAQCCRATTDGYSLRWLASCCCHEFARWLPVRCGSVLRRSPSQCW